MWTKTTGATDVNLLVTEECVEQPARNITYLPCPFVNENQDSITSFQPKNSFFTQNYVEKYFTCHQKFLKILTTAKHAANNFFHVHIKNPGIRILQKFSIFIHFYFFFTTSTIFNIFYIQTHASFNYFQQNLQNYNILIHCDFFLMYSTI